MSSNRCPYHVRQGIVDSKGKLQITEICGIKSACGQVCPLAPFTDKSFKTCQKYLSATAGADRHLLIPKSDIEYSTEIESPTNFSDTKFL